MSNAASPNYAARTFVLGVTHAQHIPERRALMARLVKTLTHNEQPGLLDTHVETTRGPWWVWSDLMWEKTYARALELGATDVVFLQDDDRIAPPFFSILGAMCDARPRDIIALDCAHPHARTVFMQGACGYTTCDGLIGLGYRWPVGEDVGQFGHFLEWRRTALLPGALKKITEDSLQGLYAIAHGLRFFHPTPTIIDHDLDVASACRNDEHVYRRPQVTWDDIPRAPEPIDVFDRAYWARDVEHFGRFYMKLHAELPLILKDTKLAEERMLAADADVCPRNRWRYFLNLQAV
jgi:hypothetical protein